jgi:hypothetical protein
MAISLRQGVGDAHEDLAEPPTLPGREYQDAGKVVFIPRDLLLAEKANYLPLRDCNRVGESVSKVAVGNVVPRRRWVLHEEVVIERGNVEEDRLIVQEEFGKEREVLGEEL